MAAGAIARDLHETVHYWQHIGHSHLIHLVEEDWRRLKHFDATGESLPPGKLRKAFTQCPENANFSTRDLMEAHARFWDVQVMGPPLLIELELDSPNRDTAEILTRPQYEKLKAEGKIWHHMDEQGNGVGYSSLSFNFAMRLASGRYSLPYLELLNQTNDLVAAALFPLCAHFALHSESPADFYMTLVKRLAPKVDLPRGRSIELAWRSLHLDVWREATLLQVERYNTEFFTGQATIHESMLFAEHPGYKLAYTLLAMASDHLVEHRPSEFLVGPKEMPSEMRALWTMDYLLGCCGMTASRAPDLLAYIAPPTIRFSDGNVWVLGALFDQLPYESEAPRTATEPPPRAEVMAVLHALDARWNDMQLKVLGL